MQSQLQLALMAALGYGSNVVYFRHGEHHLHGMLYLQLLIAVVLISVAWAVLYVDSPLKEAPRLVLQTDGVFLLSLWLSTAWYRLSPSHRLASFPGPYAWRLTKLTQAWASRHSRGFEALHRLHSIYGDYVRVGPSDISVTDPDAVEAVLGAKSQCTKSPWYDINPLHSILTIRGEREHRDIRRAYEQALREQALLKYESRIINTITEFEAVLESHGSQAIDISHWIKLLSLDINNQIAFSSKPTCLKTGKPTPRLNLLEDGLHFLGVLGPVPWLFILLLKIPFIRKEFDRGANFCADLVGDRLEDPEAGPDIISAIIDSKSPMRSNEETAFTLRGEANVLIIAANDSVTTTIVWCLYHLAAEREHAELLRKELAEIQAEHGDLTAKNLRTHAKYLDAFIYESMRLHPAVPGGAFRETPSGGIHIGQRYIPGNTVVCIPPWTLMRSPKCFVRPKEFIPKRWTTMPELILRRDAWIPFYTGTYGCVGRQLGLMETRLTISRLVRHFDISLAEGESGLGIMQHSKDHFNMSLAPLHLTFKKRSDS